MNSYHLKVNNEVAVDFYTPIDKSERMRFLKKASPNGTLNMTGKTVKCHTARKQSHDNMLRAVRMTMIDTRTRLSLQSESCGRHQIKMVPCQLCWKCNPCFVYNRMISEYGIECKPTLEYSKYAVQWDYSLSLSFTCAAEMAHFAYQVRKSTMTWRNPGIPWRRPKRIKVTRE